MNRIHPLLVAAFALAFGARAFALEPAAERILAVTPSAESYGRHLLYLTEEPHMAGTARNHALAEHVRDRLREYGLDEVSFHEFPALLSFPQSASLAIASPVEQALSLREDPYPTDKDSHLYSDSTQVAFHGYAPSGKVRAEVVYANGGSPEDFLALDRMGIDLKGRIVLMRYSNPYSYRGYKVYEAERRGAAGTLIYSDPAEDGSRMGAVYPRGPWGPESHIQWGAILYDWLGQGEPFTFHWKQAPDGRWVEGPVRDRQLPRIPSMPLNERNAAAILKQLGGPRAPDDWQGGMPITYNLGPGPVTLEMEVRNEERVGTLRSVIGVIRGREEPEKLVILGNHLDAWIYGAVDPSSGTAALLETARAFGVALKQGHRPRRTIIFAVWDGEEPLLGGSTQWALDNADDLRKNAVAYVNVDSGVQGGDFVGGATPALAEFLRGVTKDVQDPVSGRSFHEGWSARFESREPRVETIVGATDYTAFQEYLGISCIDMYFDGPYGVYHSMYDNYFRQSTVVDPGFKIGVGLARLWSVLGWRLANAEILPMRYSDYARAAFEYIEAAEKHAGDEKPLRLSAARAAAGRWEAVATELESRLDGAALEPATTRAVNERLMQVERALVEPTGQRGRPFIRHLLVAPQPSYRSAYLPRIWDALDRGDRAAVPAFEAEIVAAFDRASAILREAQALLEAGS
ncbi:MAG TPA: M28 family peptidase [Steroidobacteraceae bacterium]|nr:M28 family peptidase [Steroidobacteraceae bacterium]